MQDKLLQIINHYGIDKQLKYIHSEYFELDEAIIKAQQRTMYDTIEINNDIEYIAEEIADVMVMLKQLQYYYEIGDGYIEDIMNYKINRQLERIEKENETI